VGDFPTLYRLIHARCVPILKLAAPMATAPPLLPEGESHILLEFPEYEDTNILTKCKEYSLIVRHACSSGLTELSVGSGDPAAHSEAGWLHLSWDLRRHHWDSGDLCEARRVEGSAKGARRSNPRHEIARAACSTFVCHAYHSQAQVLSREFGAEAAALLELKRLNPLFSWRSLSVRCWLLTRQASARLLLSRALRTSWWVYKV
jgi:hypothetical protein